MLKLLRQLKYLVLIAVGSSIIAALAAFVWGAVKTVKLVVTLVKTGFGYELANVSFLEMMDAFLIAAALLIFSLGMFELFIQKLDLPEWLHVRNLHDLKAKIGGIAILVIVIAFVERLLLWQDPQGTLLFAIAIGIISAVLIAFSYFGGEN